MARVTYTLADLKEMSFGKLKVIDELSPLVYVYKKRRAIVRVMLCVCECGNEVPVRLNNLTRSHTSSCGCYKSIFFKEFNSLNNESKSKNYCTNID